MQQKLLIINSLQLNSARAAEFSYNLLKVSVIPCMAPNINYPKNALQLQLEGFFLLKSKPRHGCVRRLDV